MAMAGHWDHSSPVLHGSVVCNSLRTVFQSQQGSGHWSWDYNHGFFYSSCQQISLPLSKTGSCAVATADAGAEDIPV